MDGGPPGRGGVVAGSGEWGFVLSCTPALVV
jgi:hypothetical protein